MLLRSLFPVTELSLNSYTPGEVQYCEETLAQIPAAAQHSPQQCTGQWPGVPALVWSALSCRFLHCPVLCGVDMSQIKISA